MTSPTRRSAPTKRYARSRPTDCSAAAISAGARSNADRIGLAAAQAKPGQAKKSEHQQTQRTQPKYRRRHHRWWRRQVEIAHRERARRETEDAHFVDLAVKDFRRGDRWRKKTERICSNSHTAGWRIRTCCRGVTGHTVDVERGGAVVAHQRKLHPLRGNRCNGCTDISAVKQTVIGTKPVNAPAGITGIAVVGDGGVARRAAAGFDP